MFNFVESLKLESFIKEWITIFPSYRLAQKIPIAWIIFFTTLQNFRNPSLGRHFFYWDLTFKINSTIFTIYNKLIAFIIYNNSIVFTIYTFFTSLLINEKVVAFIIREVIASCQQGCDITFNYFGEHKLRIKTEILRMNRFFRKGDLAWKCGVVFWGKGWWHDNGGGGLPRHQKINVYASKRWVMFVYRISRFNLLDIS